MKVYLESLEHAEAGEFIRLDVTNKTEPKRTAICNALRDFMSGIDCIFQKHTCYHEERRNHPCIVEVLP